MSIWSRSHQDLARLAKDLQDKNNRTRAHRGNIEPRRQSSLSAVDTYRRKSLAAGETSPQVKKLVRGIKSVRFCLSGVNSPNVSFDEDDEQNKSTTESSSSFDENQHFKSEDNVFLEDSSQSSSLGKDEENYKIKHVSQTLKGNGFTAPNTIILDTYFENNHGEDSESTNRIPTIGDEKELKPNGSDLDTLSSENNNIVTSSPQKMVRLVSECSEDGFPGQSRQENGVSRQVMYLLQKDFINSSSGNKKPKLTLLELERTLAQLSSSQTQEGEDRHKNMIRMVETLISRQKALIQKQERRVENGKPGPKGKEVGIREDGNKEDISFDHVKNSFMKERCQMNGVSSDQRKEDYQSDGSPDVNGHVYSDHVYPSQMSRYIADKEIKDTEMKTSAGSETNEYSSGPIGSTNMYQEGQKAVQVGSSIVRDLQHFNAFDELSDEEIKDIIARGKNLLPRQNLEKRDKPPQYVSHSNSSSIDLSDSSGSLDKYCSVKSHDLTRGDDLSQNDPIRSKDTMVEGASCTPVHVKNDSSDHYNYEGNSFEDIMAVNLPTLQTSEESTFTGWQQMFRNSDAQSSSLTDVVRNDLIPVSKMDIRNQTDLNESETVSEISGLSKLSLTESTKDSANDSTSDILQRNKQWDKHSDDKENLCPPVAKSILSGFHRDLTTESLNCEYTEELSKDKGIDKSTNFTGDQTLDVSYDGCDFVCKDQTQQDMKHVGKSSSPNEGGHTSCPKHEVMKVHQHHKNIPSSDDTENSCPESKTPGYHGMHGHICPGSKNQCLCSVDVSNHKGEQKLFQVQHQKNSTRRVTDSESSGNCFEGGISKQTEIHSLHEEENVHQKKRNKVWNSRAVKSLKHSYCKQSYDSDFTNESGCTQSCRKKQQVSPMSQDVSGSSESTSPCHCTFTRRKKYCGRCEGHKHLCRKQKHARYIQKYHLAVPDDNSSVNKSESSSSDIGLSTWSGTLCHCSRCLAVSVSRSSISQNAGEPAGSFARPRSGKRLNPAFMLDSLRRYPDSKHDITDYDIHGVNGDRRHKHDRSHHRNDFRIDRNFRLKKYSKPDDLSQYVVYRSDSSEVFETHSRSDYSKVIDTPYSSVSPSKTDTVQGTAQPVDGQMLKEILVDFHELFLCLCRDRQLKQQGREEQEQEGGAVDESSVKQGEDNTETTGAASEKMESLDTTYQQLDSEFDKVLADMKPHVLKLPHKSDRQRCAVWIKKLCEPPSSGVTGRKNRNMYGQLMLQMLKRGVLEGPFDKKPDDGPLPTLPPYMSIYFDEPMTGRDGQGEGDVVPDWVNGELLESVGSSMYRKSTIGNPAATSTWLSCSSTGHDIRERFNAVFYSPRRVLRPYSSLGVSLDKDPSLSPKRRSYTDRGERGAVGGSAGEDRIGNGSIMDPFPSELPPTSYLNDMDWSKPYSSTTFSSSLPKGTTFQDDTSIGRGGEREVELRTKMVEAKYHEEKLRLQQRHDGAVQKILDRKNAEIDDVKNHYRGKAKDLEDVNSKLDRKIQSLLKEMSMIRDSKDKQIAELKKLVEDTSDSRKSEFDKKLHEVTAEFEQEKFDMQKQHTRNIQEILDDTNARLQRMEKEYTQQMASNTNVIRELETRVQQLASEAEQQMRLRSGLEREKTDLEEKCEQATAELGELTERYSELERENQQQQESHEHELRTVKHKTEASLEFLKQEHTLAAGKASDAVKEMEHQVDEMRRKMKDSDDQCQRQIRDIETVHQQDKLHLENLHDKQIRSMKKELEQLEQESQKKIRHLEHLLQQKDIEISRWKEQNHDQARSAERALEEFKAEVEKNQTRMYEEMKQQMTQVEFDLNKSKQAREKQNKELSRQLAHEKSKYERQMTEMKVSFEHEKSQMMHDLHLQKEYILSEHEKAVDTLKEGHRVELRSLEARYRERQEKDTKNVTEYESQVRELREELVQSNQLRKQQLVELGLLREEEKQKMQRDHEHEVSRLRSDMEQQRLELQKSHSGEMETMLEKTNQRLKGIEKEYAVKGQKSAEVVAEFQASTNQLREEIKRIREQSDHRMAELVSQQEDDKKAMKKQYSTNITALQKELDSQRSKCRHMERQLQRMDADQEEKVTRLKLTYEEKMRGLMPAAVRQELEDTISSLKSQVNSLQQRAAVLQDELDLKIKNPLGSFGTLTSSPIIKSSV